MPHRAHLFSLRIGHALRESAINERYSLSRLQKDILAGITVGIIAIPLSMALAIASGVAPQYGLYTAIIGGFLIALTGGSRVSISGPTAAFVVILVPIAHEYGLAGLLLATVGAGFILVALALLRLGRLIEYIPEAVTLGFTGGIAVVIATLQLKDFLGLKPAPLPDSYIGKVQTLIQALPTTHWPSLVVATVTLAVLLAWPRLKTPVPPHLPAVVVGGLLGYFLNRHGFSVATIGTQFHYVLDNGVAGGGIPPQLPELRWPWQQPGPHGVPFHLDWPTIQALAPKAFAIAMLGAIESLLCAVVLDGMTGKRHSANSELLGQGIGNIVTPFFGGIPATAAIARSAANFRAGAQSPISSMVHALVVLLALAALAPLLSYLPMPVMAALLMLVAWNMSEAPKALHLLKTAPRGDILVFVTCISLTVLLDMVIAITVGIVLAALLFMREIAEMTKVSDITDKRRLQDIAQMPVPEGWRVFKINGPLFFAAADRVFGELSVQGANLTGIILHMDGVPLLDAGGLASLNRLVEACRKNHTEVLLAELQFQPLKTLAKAGVKPIDGVLKFFSSLEESIQYSAHNRDRN